MWYKDGVTLNITSHSRTEYQRAGSKHILIIHNTQASDFGTYMCYATNSIGIKLIFQILKIHSLFTTQVLHRKQ